MQVALWICCLIWTAVMTAGAIGLQPWVVGIGAVFAIFFAVLAIYESV